ncbi:MAG: hypothetical protein R2761_25175 [Acidimicrobiales bacterium]
MAATTGTGPGPVPGPVRVAMWSGPRNLSTALMRAWENRPDTAVLDEPLYAWYLARTGLDHPGRHEILAAYPADAEGAVARCLAPAPPGVRAVYQKHMTHHLLPELDRGWLDELRHFMLLRDPVAVLASYTQVREAVTLADIGLPQQLELVDRAELVIDADDFLGDPQAYLEILCQRLDLPFSERMLSWPAGRRDSDGCWAPYWYAAVESSTGFNRPRSRAAGGVDRLPPHLRPLAEEALDIYATLASRRLVL